MSLLTSLTRIWLTRSFKPFQFTNQHTPHLDYHEVNRLGLYVHIPFCRSLCEFCPYCKTVYKEDMAHRYLQDLLQEIELVGSSLQGKKKQVTSLYFGGGTPALMAKSIASIIQKLQEYFIITEGIGLELHPKDVTVEKLTLLKQAGVTKISIGIQSFQPEYAQLLGREAIPYQPMIEALKQVPFETVSMDFIFGLPNQTLDLLIQDVETAFSYGANHVATYPFIDFTYTKRRFDKLSEKDKKQLLYEFVAYCESKNYVRDSIWTFSKTGQSQYSSMTRENFLGFGCSSTTLLHDQFKINTFDLDEYHRLIQKNLLPSALTLQFTRRQRMVYYLFWTLYSMQITEADFQSFFDTKLSQAYGSEFTLARWLGWVKKEKDTYRMTTRGSYYYHYLENFYTLSYIDHMWNTLRSNATPPYLTIK